MFYNEALINNILKCKHCKQKFDVYDQPQILPCCSQTLCNRCISLIEKSVKDKKLKCFLCQKESKLPENGFIKNDLALQLLSEQPKEIYRGEACEKLKANISSLEDQIKRIKFEANNGDYVIKEYFVELRRLIQLATEKKIQEIYSSCDNLILKVNDHERDCLQNYTFLGQNNSLFNQHVTDLTNKAKLTLEYHRDYLKRVKLNDNEMVKSNEKLNDLRRLIEKEKTFIKKTFFKNRLMEFVSNKTNQDTEMLIGYLKFNTIQLSLSVEKFFLIKNYCTIYNYKIILYFFKKLISCSGDSTIKVWDLETGKCIQTLKGHTAAVKCGKIHDFNKLISCSDDETIKIWDLEDGQCLKTLLGHSSYVNCIVVLAENLLASCSHDKTIRVWNLESGSCLITLEGHTEAIWRIIPLSNNQLISCSSDKTIKLWDWAVAKCLKTFMGHDDRVYDVISLPGDRLVSCSKDETIKIWNLTKSECIQTLLGHTDIVFCIRLVADNQIISCSFDKSIKIWCLESNSCLKTLNGHLNYVRSISVISNNKVVSCSDDKTLKIWDISNEKCSTKLDAHNDYIFSIEAF